MRVSLWDLVRAWRSKINLFQSQNILNSSRLESEDWRLHHLNVDLENYKFWIPCSTAFDITGQIFTNKIKDYHILLLIKQL